METFSTTEIMMGLIITGLTGVIIGNYTTSLIYRLPLGETPFEKHPYCGDCNTFLTPRDLMPILSFALSKGTCRYCGSELPLSYMLVEVAGGVVFITNFLIFGVSESFILASALATFLMVQASLEAHEGRLFAIITLTCGFLAAMLRLQQDGSIYPMIESGFLMLFIAVIVWKLSGLFSRTSGPASTPESTGYRVPIFAVMAGLTGLALPLTAALMAFAGGAALYALQRLCFGLRAQSLAFGLALWLALLAQEQQLIG